MKAETILILILCLITFDFVFEQLMDYINLKARKVHMPEEVSDFYDQEKYVKSQQYHSTLTRFSFVTSTFSFILSFVLLSQGFFGWLDSVLLGYSNNTIVVSLIYFGVLFIASDLLNIPFQLYSTFVIEEKYDFNKTTPKTFVFDKFKGYLLSILVGGVLVGLLLYLIFHLGENFWMIFWIVAVAFMFLANVFYTSWILPLFNKLTPMEDGELKKSIENYAQGVDFPLDNIYIIDGSKRSNKANAFFSGMGKRKKIVLYDTLINNHTNEELVAVLAHEVGHFKKKHIVQGFAMSIVQIGIMLFVLSLMIYNKELSVALGAEQVAVHLNLLAFGILYSPISKVMGVISNMISRKNEFEADAFAANTYSGEALQQALKKLSVDSLSNLFPHPAYVFMNYSHPPLLKRLSAIGKKSAL